MVGFLPPLVQEAPVTGSLAVSLYALSSAATAAALGAALGWLGGHLPPAGRPAALALFVGLALLCAALDARAQPAGILQRRRQVPEVWLHNLGPARASVLYGASMGNGLVTYITVAGFYLVLGWALLAGPIAGAQIGALYGAAQCGPVVLAGLSQLAGARHPVDGGRLDQRALRGAVALLAVVLALTLSPHLW